jgi:hypothetical protein
VIGVHAPEFAFEKNIDNVKQAAAKLEIHYPVAIDNHYAIWRGFENEYWPAHNFIDAQGRIRHCHVGDGDYAELERIIKELLAKAGKRKLPSGLVSVAASAAEAVPDEADNQSPETYVGYMRSENFVSPGGVVNDVGHLRPGRSQAERLGPLGRLDGRRPEGTLNAKGGSITVSMPAICILCLGPEATASRCAFTSRSMALHPAMRMVLTSTLRVRGL